MSTPSDPARPLYEPPTDDDAPLDAIEEVWVRMWADIIVAEIREELAQEQRSPEANDQSGDTRRCREQGTETG